MKTVALLLILASTIACGSVPERHPLPEDLVAQAVIPGEGPGEARIRRWGDALPPFADEWFAMPDEEMRRTRPGIYGTRHTYLAISGGGANGAFAAGLLCGWTMAGNRPEFTLVTGISTGALIAPFAFLGPDYDHLLRKFYTTTSTDDVMSMRSTLTMLTSDAAADTEPLQALLAELIDDDLVAAIAREHARGRRLTIGTTNLDAGRPVHWDIGAIAAGGAPGAKELIRQVMLASASIPGVFPPVLIEVEAGGKRYDELHVDGGSTAQVYLHPAGSDWERVLEKLHVPGRPDIYLIRNSRMDPRYEPVENRLLPIIGRSLDSLIRTQGLGNMYEIYLLAKRDELNYNLAYIPADFDVVPQEAFDPVYMKALFDRGCQAAQSGHPWKKAPPGYDQAAGKHLR